MKRSQKRLVEEYKQLCREKYEIGKELTNQLSWKQLAKAGIEHLACIKLGDEYSISYIDAYKKVKAYLSGA